MAAGLRDAGCDVEIFVQGLSDASTSEQDGMLVHRVIPRIHGFGPRIGGDLGGGSLATIGLFSWSLAREFCKAFSARHEEKPFDVIDAHEHLGVSSLICRRADLRSLTVTRYQTPYDSFVTRKMANWPRSRLVRWLEGTAIRRARVRVATSHSIEYIVREDFPRAPPVEDIIPNLTGIASPDREVDTTEQRDPLMLFVGRLMPGHKNPDHAARAFSSIANEYPDWRIEFAGNDIPLDDKSTMWDVCEEILRPHPGRYHYHGMLEPADLRALYRRARILIMPSRIESYGLVAIEAMSNGCVPIVTDDTALPEVVGDAGVVFENGRVDALERCLRQLLDDESQWRDYQRAGIQRVRTEFAPESVVSMNLAMFERELSKV